MQKPKQKYKTNPWLVASFCLFSVIFTLLFVTLTADADSDNICVPKMAGVFVPTEPSENSIGIMVFDLKDQNQFNLYLKAAEIFKQIINEKKEGVNG